MSPDAKVTLTVCPFCHAVGGHLSVPRPDDPSRLVRCPNEAIEQGRTVRVWHTG